MVKLKKGRANGLDFDLLTDEEIQEITEGRHRGNLQQGKKTLHQKKMEKIKEMFESLSLEEQLMFLRRT